MLTRIAVPAAGLLLSRHQQLGAKILPFVHYTCLLPLGPGTDSPECVSVRVPVLAAGIPTVPHPYMV